MNNKIVLIAVSAILVAAPLFASADTLNRQLDMGMTGTDVSALQTFLASDNTIYPQGLVTGYFGFLTQAAVSNFQSRNGLPAVGRVGPMTLPVLNLQIADGMSGGTTGASTIAPTITSVSVSTGSNSASVAWNTNQAAQGVVYYSATPLMTSEHANSVGISGNTAVTDNSYKTAQDVSIQNLQANTIYYYEIYTTDQLGNVSVTWPSTFQTN